MSARVEIALPDEVYHRAEGLARLMNRDVAEVLAETVALALPPLSAWPQSGKPVTDLTDEEVLAFTELQMEAKQDRRLSLLLDGQQAGELSDAERAELWALMQIYQEGLLRKAQALHEAVRRGLREPLEP